VSIPLGSAHLPADRIGAARSDSSSTALGADAFVEEAERWFPADSSVQIQAADVADAASAPHPRIVLVEDNADMRDYLGRLLLGAYRIESFADGQAALQAVLRDPPDLVLTDVMMPRLDGFGLLKVLRANPDTASVPVILLSARAGEESRVEGISAGADDYLIKPFSAREIVARVENHIALSRLRRDGEDRLRRSEERFRALVSASSDVIFRMSPDWGEIWKLEGRGFLSNSDIPNRSWLEAYIDRDDQPQVRQAIETAIRNKAPFELEHRVRRADSSLGWAFSRAVPLLDADGKITEWFGAARDITERKQSEQALLRSEKLATLGRMAATIAHEINNPLESVTNLLFLANQTENLPDPVHRFLQMADVELQRVAHIARQSLGFYRESNAPALTSVNALIDSSIGLLESKINEKQASVQKDWRSDIRITAVAGELRQVFSNLLANSLDAIDMGGRICVRVSEMIPALTSLARPRAHSVRITIVDDGRGIHPSIRHHIFEPFFTTKGTVGTGLGLWVTRQIVDKHGGTISVRSQIQGATKGTTFSIVLPVQAAPGLAAR
jgi:PAS domain S-box-containing protein